MHAMTTHDRQTTPLRWQRQFSPVHKCVPLARSLVSKTLASRGYGEVSDASRTPTRPTKAGEKDEGGRGLLLVDSLSGESVCTS